MTNKKIALSLTLLFLSIALGILLGLLDFFGFLSGRHALNFVYLISTFLSWHFLGLTLFLMQLENSRHEVVYLATATVFGTIFFFFNQSYLSALLATTSFFLFQIYTERKLTQREKMFVNFSTREIVFPVIRKSFLFLLVILVIIGFFQGRSQAQRQSLVTPATVRTLSRPAVFLLNKQISAQLQKQLGNRFQSTLGTTERRSIVTFVLNELLETMDEGTTRQYFGINRENIPLDKTIVYDNGDIDLTPVVDSMAGNIAEAVNRQISMYLPLIPLFFGFLVFVFVSPLVTISEFVFLPVIRLIVMVLLKLGVISITQETVQKEVLKL